MHDVAWRGMWICVRGKDAQKHLARTSLRWPNTVFVRALADAIQRVHKDCKNKQAVDTVIILFAQCPLCLCYFSS